MKISLILAAVLVLAQLAFAAPTADAGGPYTCVLDAGMGTCGMKLDGGNSSDPVTGTFTTPAGCTSDGIDITCQYGTDKMDDAKVDAFMAANTTNYGSQESTFTYWNASSRGDILFKFNDTYPELNASPKIQLALYHKASWVYDDSYWAGHPNEVRLRGYKVSEGWGEGTVTAATAPGFEAVEKSELVLSNATAENKCNIAILPCTQVGGLHWIYMDITDIYREWIADPATNHGIFVRDIDGDFAAPSGAGAASGNQFLSSESLDLLNRPKLIFKAGIEFDWWISDDTALCEIVGATDVVSPIIGCGQEGLAKANVRVTNNAGESTDAFAWITVTSSNSPPTADAGADKTVLIDTPTVLAGTASDPDTQILTTVWVLSDGTGASADCTAAGEDTLNYQVECSSVGTRTATLTVTDPFGASASDSAEVSVEIVSVGKFQIVGLTSTSRTPQADEEITVTVRILNLSTTGRDFDLDVIFQNPVSGALEMPTQNASGTIASGAEQAFNFTYNSASEFAPLTGKNFKVVANVYESSSGSMDDSATMSITIFENLAPALAVPETSIAIVALIAFAVLLIIERKAKN